MSFWGQVGLQEGSSVLGVEVQCLYDYAMVIMILVFSFVGFSLLKMVINKSFSAEYLESQWLETVWTVLPCGLLLMLGLPSIKLLYLMDELDLPEATVKIIGHQWYWSYEYSDTFGSSYSYDSYMVVDSGLSGGYSLLEVDSRCVVAALLQMRGLVTSDDVIHSWAIPSASIKADAIPGRINQVSLCFLYSGVFYGQCSELCGVNHSFMPICVEAVSVEVFGEWIISNHKDINNSAGGISVVDIWKKVWKVLRWGTCCAGEVIWKGVVLYAWWFKSVFYYGLYVPIEFVFLKSWGLTKWTASACFSLVKWVGWFLVSPVDATIYGVTYVFGQVCSGVWYVVTKPFEFSYWFVKTVVKGISSLFKFSVFVFESVLSSMSSFTDDGFKEVVMQRVNLNTFKFLWIISNYYKNR
uniref:Cytochrome c oxidase subunit 2 n=1 Tax=Lanceolaria lanceolata TaxID=2508263 RepID=A0A1W5HZA3_LANLA|nr:cytochrome c oxidase subunit II [Lanceolaria lanceolata]